MNVLETERLSLRELTLEDAPFIVELVNDPDWLRYIGDRGVRTLDDARDYIRNGPMTMYATHGFGLYLTALRSSGKPVGICGLIKRDTLEDVDVGFALLPAFRGRGYARESAAAALAQGRDVFRLRRIVAIVSADNRNSKRLLEDLGMRFEKTIELTPGTLVQLFAIEFR